VPNRFVHAGASAKLILLPLLLYRFLIFAGGRRQGDRDMPNNAANLWQISKERV
jgi:hypothetical protein